LIRRGKADDALSRICQTIRGKVKKKQAAFNHTVGTVKKNLYCAEELIGNEKKKSVIY
jgi:hypothetical protein